MSRFSATIPPFPSPIKPSKFFENCCRGTATSEHDVKITKGPALITYSKSSCDNFAKELQLKFWTSTNGMPRNQACHALKLERKQASVYDKQNLGQEPMTRNKKVWGKDMREHQRIQDTSN
eukprot:1813976-Amphidinium_carterae.2